MMPLLDAVATLPVRPMRVLVAGTSGAGKTTVARRVSVLLDIPHIEIDALFHGPGWTPQGTFESGPGRRAGEGGRTLRLSGG